MPENSILNEVISITDEEYRLIGLLIYDRFGIHLGSQKKSLIVGRLQKVLKNQGFGSFKDYYDYIINDHSGQALNTLINRVSTNHTYFNRENAHFDFFVNHVLPEHNRQSREKKDYSLRLWSAGCSSGEEPYMLAMLLNEYFQSLAGKWDLGILATDISQRALDKAQQGIYGLDNVDRLPSLLKNKYFQRLADNQIQVIELLKKMVLFRRLNLMRSSFPFKQKFHVIFCRNVMIYFDANTRDALMQRFHQNLGRGGFLFIGHSESLGQRSSLFKYVQPAVYQKIE